MNDFPPRRLGCAEVVPHETADHADIRGRFADRTKRLARRQESDVFRVYLMPVSWILALAGLLGLVALWMAEGKLAMTQSTMFPVFVALFCAPALTAVARLVRGHFHRAVREL